VKLARPTGLDRLFCINADGTFYTNDGIDGRWINVVVGTIATAHLAGTQSFVGFFGQFAYDDSRQQ
jgi:hypothetical protein